MKNVYVTLSRDPFARTEVIRSVETLHEHRQSDGCAWCGGFRRVGEKSLFRYGTETDSGRTYKDAKAFCSIGCRNSY